MNKIGANAAIWRQFKKISIYKNPYFLVIAHWKMRSRKIWLKIRKAHVFLRQKMLFQKNFRWEVGSKNSAEEGTVVNIKTQTQGGTLTNFFLPKFSNCVRRCTKLKETNWWKIHQNRLLLWWDISLFMQKMSPLNLS